MNKRLKKTLLATVAITSVSSAALLYYGNQMEITDGSSSFGTSYQSPVYNDSLEYPSETKDSTKLDSAYLETETINNIDSIMDQTFNVIKLITLQNQQKKATPFAQYGTISIEEQALKTWEDSLDEILEQLILDWVDENILTAENQAELIALLHEKFDPLILEYQQALKVVNDLKADIEIAITNLEKLLESFKNAVIDGIEIEGSINKITELIAKTQEKIDALNEQITILQDKISKLEQEILDIENEVEGILLTLQDLYANVTKNNELIAEAEAWKADLEKFITDNPSETEQIALANEIIKILDAKIASLNTENETLLNDWITDHEDVLSQDYLDIIAKNDSLTGLKADLEALGIDLDALISEKGNYELLLSGLNDDLSEALNKVQTLEAEIEAAVAAINGTGGLLGQLADANVDLEAAAQTIYDEVNNVKNILQEAMDQVPSLIDAIEEYLKQLLFEDINDWINNVLKPWQEGNVGHWGLEDIDSILSDREENLQHQIDITLERLKWQLHLWEMMWNDNYTHPWWMDVPRNGFWSNKYEDTTGWFSDKIYTLPWHESSISYGSTVIEDPSADEEVKEEFYDLTYSVAARSGVDYLDFEYDKIEILDQDDNVIDYDVTQKSILDDYNANANGGGYALYEYEYTLHNLRAGTEYQFFMQQNVNDTFSDYFNDHENYIEINKWYPTLHYMPNEITDLNKTINWVDGYISFNIADGDTAEDITQDDMQVLTIDPETNDILLSTSIDTWEEDGKNTKVTATIGKDLMPEENFRTAVFLKGNSVIEFEWTTKDWNELVPPVITPEVDVDSVTQHEATINYSINVPASEDIPNGYDQTILKGVKLYQKSAYDAGGVPEQEINDLDLSAGTYDNKFDLADLELDTEYTYVIEVWYQGFYQGEESLNKIVSDDITFKTKGLKAPAAPEFDPDPNKGFVNTSSTANSLSFSFRFKDPATQTDHEDTVIPNEDLKFYISETGGTLVQTADVTWDSNPESATIIDADDTVGNDNDEWYFGTVDFTNLQPNTTYDLQVGLSSNYSDEIDADGFLIEGATPTIIYSNILTETTLKLPGRPPEWDATEPFEFVDRDESSLTFNYKFNVPVDNPSYEDTDLTDFVAYSVDSIGTQTELTLDTDYKVTEVESGDSEGTGTYSGSIQFINLDPNTEYSFQLGLRSKSLVPETHDEVQLAEVFSDVQTKVTDKLDAREPFFDATNGLEVTNITENSVEVSYHFFIPEDDEDYYNTLFDEIIVYTKDTYLGETEFTTTDDIVITPEIDGIVSAGNKEYTGKILVNNLPPEDTFELQIGVISEAEDVADGYEDIDGEPIDPPEIKSEVVNFETLMMSPQPPYFITDEVEGTTGFDFKEKLSTSMEFDFEFMIPVKEHGYAPTEFTELHFYLGDSESTIVEIDNDQVEFSFDETGNSDGEGIFSGSINFINLQPRTEYWFQIGIESNYVGDKNDPKTGYIMSEVVNETTAWEKSFPPKILSAEVRYDYVDERYILDIEVQTAYDESNPSFAGNNVDDDYSDTLLTKIHVGNVGNPDTYATSVTLKESEQGAGVEVMNYEVKLNSKIDFQNVYSDMVVTIDYEDDQTAAVSEWQKGSVTYTVPEFKTKDIYFAQPEFLSVSSAGVTAMSKIFNYNMDLDASVKDLGIDFNDITQWTDEDINRYGTQLADDQLSGTQLKRLYVVDSTTGIEYGSTDLDPDKFGKIEINGLSWGTTYNNMVLKADYYSTRQSNDEVLNEENPDFDSSTDPSYGNLLYNTVEYELPEFTTLELTDPDYSYDKDSEFENLQEPPRQGLTDIPKGSHFDAEGNFVTPDGVVIVDKDGNANPDFVKDYEDGWSQDIVTTDPVDPVDPDKPDPGDDKSSINWKLIIAIIIVIILTGIIIAVIVFTVM